MDRDFATPEGMIHVRNLPSAEKAEVTLAITGLLKEKLQIADLEVKHRESGQPYIAQDESLHISISHTQHLFAVYISKDRAAGIDLELENPRIEKATAHFINDIEKNIFQAPTIQEFHLIWGAKEAIYKHFGGNFSTLENEVTILSINPGSRVIHASTIHGLMACSYEIIGNAPANNAYLVWTSTEFPA